MINIPSLLALEDHRYKLNMLFPGIQLLGILLRDIINSLVLFIIDHNIQGFILLKKIL